MLDEEGTYYTPENLRYGLTGRDLDTLSTVDAPAGPRGDHQDFRIDQLSGVWEPSGPVSSVGPSVRSERKNQMLISPQTCNPPEKERTPASRSGDSLSYRSAPFPFGIQPNLVEGIKAERK